MGTSPSVEALVAHWRRTGDRRSRDRAVRCAMPMARALALRYRGGSEPVEDLVQVANLGLVNAVDRFDPDRCPVFARFAVPTILGELRRHFRTVVWVLRTPRSLQEAYLDVRRGSDRLMQRHGRSPTVSELCEATGLHVELVVEALAADAAQQPMSLDAPVASAEDMPQTLCETIGAEDERLALATDALALGLALSRLTRRQRRILALRFKGDLVQHEIAQVLGCSQMQISRELRRALAALREDDALTGAAAASARST